MRVALRAGAPYSSLAVTQACRAIVSLVILTLVACIPSCGKPKASPAKAVGPWPPGFNNDAALGVATPDAACLFRISNGDKYGFINPDGALVIPAIYDSAPLGFSEGLAVVLKGSAWLFIDSAGQVVIDTNFRTATAFSEGFAAVQAQNGKWGFIDRQAKLAIPCQYDVVLPFRNGVACIGIETARSRLRRRVADVGAEEFEWTAIDTSGQTVPLPSLAAKDPGADVLTPFREGGKVGYRRAGAVLIPPQYRQARVSHEGLAAALREDGWVFLDTSGQVTLGPFRGDLIGFGFNCGLVGFETQGPKRTNTTYYDKTGRIVWPP